MNDVGCSSRCRFSWPSLALNRGFVGIACSEVPTRPLFLAEMKRQALPGFGGPTEGPGERGGGTCRNRASSPLGRRPSAAPPGKAPGRLMILHPHRSVAEPLCRSARGRLPLDVPGGAEPVSQLPAQPPSRHRQPPGPHLLERQVPGEGGQLAGGAKGRAGSRAQRPSQPASLPPSPQPEPDLSPARLPLPPAPQGPHRQQQQAGRPAGGHWLPQQPSPTGESAGRGG